MERMISLPPLGLSEKWEFRHMPKGTDANAEERCQWRELGSRQRQVVQVTSGHGGGGSPSCTQVPRPARDRRHGDAGILEPPPLTATRFRCVGAF